MPDTTRPTVNSGIQNYNSTVGGPQAAGSGASATQTVNQTWNTNPAPGDADGAQATAALIAAVGELRLEFERFRAQQPDAMSDNDTRDTETALTEIGELAEAAEPDRRAIGRRVTVLTDILGTIAGFAKTIATLGSAFEKITELF